MTMRWEDERYVRLYTRDTPDWLAWSFEAQALFALLMRKVDRAGVLPLGKQGKRAVAIAIGHAHRWDALATAFEELLADGCIVVNAERLLIRNFLEAQEAKQSDTARQRKARELARALGPHVTPRDEMSQGVTECHDSSRAVTRGHTASHAVTPSLAVPSLAVPSKGDAPAALPPLVGDSLLDRVTAAFFEARRQSYALDRKDEAALRVLIIKAKGAALSAEDEVLRRWGIALAWRGFPACSSLAQLAQHWNHYAQPQEATTGPPARAADARRGVVRAEDQQHGTPGVSNAFE